jgi:hypothetical protein
MSYLQGPIGPWAVGGKRPPTPLAEQVVEYIPCTSVQYTGQPGY